jgi:hypothetical protein
MTEMEKTLTRLHEDLGWKRLSRGWAKAEIFFGLTAAGIGLTLLFAWVIQPAGSPPDWPQGAGGLLLFVLGWYLALAGHRSHLYRSSMHLTAYLIHRTHPSQPPG